MNHYFLLTCEATLLPFFRVHERVLPCIQNSIENNKLRSPSDWFFSMTFDFEMAKRTSIAMCKKLKSIKSDNLQTIHSQIFNVYLQRVLQTNLTLITFEMKSNV